MVPSWDEGLRQAQSKDSDNPVEPHSLNIRGQHGMRVSLHAAGAPGLGSECKLANVL